MKITSFLALCLLPLGTAAAVRAQDIKFSVPGDSQAGTPAPAPAPAPASPASAYTTAQLSEEAGWAIAKQSGVSELGFNADEIQAFMKGFAAAVGGQSSPYDLKSVIPPMNAFMTQKQAAFIAKLKEQNAVISAAFFAKISKDKDIVALPSGLYYKILAVGDGVTFAKPTDVVKVNYIGALVDGSIFDTSAKQGKPVEFQLDQVIPGWTEGIQKVAKGGKIKLFIPSSLAYGDQGRPGIPPGSTLVFDIELLDIRPSGSGSGSAAGAP
jgi:FKBP-type peptidyl-prolyl cis-trans isomerase